MTSPPLIEFSGVTLRLGDRLLFPNTCWTFAANQNWVLAGSNGSGKTLLARAIAGEVPVVKGEIRYGINPPEGRLPEDCIRLVSFEQQKALAGDAPAATRWFSIEQEASLTAGRFLSQEMIEEINPFEVRPRREQSPHAFRDYRRKILDLMQIRPLLRRFIPSLSNGEMRKVLIARALLRKPRLLILDDAFAGLDAKYRPHLKKILEDLMRSGSVRILLIDSLVHELPKGISHLLFVDGCRVIAQGPYRAMRRHQTLNSLFCANPVPGPRDRAHMPRKRQSSAGEELVRFENASVQYGGRNILSGIDWIIRRGENWALIGPNGSGKSTLLSLINGDNPQAYANQIYIFRRRRGTGESVWSIKKRIGYISPELHLHFPDDQTCLQTVASGFKDSMGCFTRFPSGQRAAALKMLDTFGLMGLANTLFHSLSTGSQRMVLLARALVKEPDLLLLDEPCQGLDLRHRAAFLKTVDSLLHFSGTTVIYVTHRMEEIPKGISRILRLKSGRIVSAGALK